MKISVVIPHVNRESQINLCLESLESQKMPYEDYEVIVAGEVGKNWLERKKMCLKHIPYCFEGGEKFSAAKLRNMGADNASGELLAFIDCDIILSPDYLLNTWKNHKQGKKLSFVIRKNLPKNAVLTSIRDIKRYQCEYDGRMQAYRLFGGDFTKIKSIWTWVYGHTMALDRDVFFELGRFRERFKGWGTEDTEFAFRIMKSGIPIVCDIKSGCHHIWHEESLKGDNVDQHTKNMRMFKELHNYDPAIDCIDLIEHSAKTGLLCHRYKIDLMAIWPYLAECYLRGLSTGQAYKESMARE